jgi:uncharacterized membrane protein YfhO
MLFEGGMSAVKGAVTSGSSDRGSYPASAEAVRGVIDYIYGQDDGFYRLEMARWWGTNDPTLYGYRGISQFSSEANGRFTNVLEKLGIKSHPGGNKYLYASATPVANMLLNLKYMMTRENHSSMNSVSFEKIYDYYRPEDLEPDYPGTPVSLAAGYKNKYWLPAAFMMSENVNEADLEEANPFITQNGIMKKASGITGDVFSSIYPQIDNSNNSNANISAGAYGTYSYSTPEAGKKGTVRQKYISPVQQQMYIYLKNQYHDTSKNAEVSVYSSGGAKISYSASNEVENGATIDCGIVPENGWIEVTFDVKAGGGTFYLYAAAFHEEIFKEGYDILNQNTMTVTEFDDTVIKGEITAENDGLFFASIPYDKGWHVKIDGVEREVNPPSEAELRNAEINEDGKNVKEKKDPKAVETLRDGFITLPLEAGTHTVEMYYVTDGLIPGIAITCSSILLIISWELLSRVSRNRKNALKKFTADDEDEDENDGEETEKNAVTE